MFKEDLNQIVLVELPPLRVACFRAISRTPEDDALKVLTQWSEGVGVFSLPRNFGFDVDVTPEQAEAGLRGYELWFVVGERAMSSGAVQVRDFPGGRFAAMTLHDPFADSFARIPAGWDALHEWVITGGFELPGATLCLEELVERDGRRDLVLYHPVRES